MNNSRLRFLMDMDWKKTLSIIIKFGCGAGTAKLFGYGLLSFLSCIAGIISVFIIGILERMILDKFPLKQAVLDSLADSYSVAFIIFMCFICKR